MIAEIDHKTIAIPTEDRWHNAIVSQKHASLALVCVLKKLHPFIVTKQFIEIGQVHHRHFGWLVNMFPTASLSQSPAPFQYQCMGFVLHILRQSQNRIVFTTVALRFLLLFSQATPVILDGFYELLSPPESSGSVFSSTSSASSGGPAVFASRRVASKASYHSMTIAVVSS